MHPNQLVVSVDTVRELVDLQFPRWRNEPIRRIASTGTVDAIFRIGERLTARFGLVPGDVESVRGALRSEADAARELFGRTRFPTPEPIALGEPGAGYPQPWSVQTWLPGVIATEEDPGESVAFARDLAEFIRDVRRIDTCGRIFSGHGRGGNLRAHDAWVESCFERSEHFLDVARLRRIWHVIRDTPRGTGGDVMSHGDLIPGNLLVASGRLTGVLDVGGVGPADPALDLVGAWHLLEAGPRQVLREDLGCADHEWARGRAWAFVQALGVWYYADSNPSMYRMGLRTLHRIMADESSGA